VLAVGIDYLSVGGCGPDGDATHRTLLAAGIWVVEGLDLSRVSPGCYELLCLPLRLAAAEGAPARALLRIIDAHGEG
jgi:arylformamidase